jgi:hypothetical protein
MRTARALLALSIVVGFAVPALAAGAAATARKHRNRTSSKSMAKHTTKFVPRQRSIDDDRATEIQQALIKAGYLTGQPTGHWDDASIAAMTKLQADNGWQTKLVPDSRALIKLGLGPSSVSAEAATQATASIGAPASAAYAQ